MDSNSGVCNASVMIMMGVVQSQTTDPLCPTKRYLTIPSSSFTIHANIPANMRLYNIP